MNATGNVTFEQVVSLYERAGFIYPEKKSFLGPYWREIEETWTSLLATRDGIFQFNHRTKDDVLSSSICIAQYTDRTWMIQHAVGAHDPGGVLGNLLDVCEWAVSNPHCRYVRFLYRPTNRWPSLVFGQLTPRLQEGSYETHVYNYYTGQVNQELPSAPRNGGEVVYLEPEDYEWFERMLGERHSQLFIEAKGLTADELELPFARGKYAAAGLTRRRRILVARHQGELIGYSVLDQSSLGINLSFLLNAFTITMLREDEQAEHGLVNASINHYKALGRRFVVALSEGTSGTSFTKSGLETRKQYAEMLTRVEGNFSGAVAHFKQFYKGIGAR